MPLTNLYKSRILGKSPNRRRFLQNSAAALSGLCLSSCGWTLGATSEATEQEDPSDNGKTQTSSDELYIYTWADYTDSDLLDSFTAQTGIKPIVDIFDSNEAMLAKVQAGGGGAYSIIYPSDYMVRKMAGLQLLRELDHSRIEGLGNLFEKFQNPGYDSNNRYSVPFTWGTTGLVYNADKISPEPEDWNYLWDRKPELLRQMTLMNDVREVMGAALRSLGYSYNSENSAEIKAAYEKLVELKVALANFTTDGWRDLILAGDLEIAMGYGFDALTVSEENPSIKYVVPSSGTSLFTDTIVIPKKAPNIKGAYAWINFMLQPEVTAELCERLYLSTPNRKTFELLPVDFQEDATLFPPESVLAKCEGILPLNDEKEKEYARYWIKLKSS